MSDERFRPRFHFTAPRHWLNDPNGLCFHGGRWHLHYQHNPRAPRWGDIHWGHASSADLATWRDEPVALAPSLDHDALHCFSGCIAIADDGSATAYYTGVGTAGQSQCAAHSRDLRHWSKHPRPLVATPPEGVSAEDFRDPFVWRDGSGWAMAVGASLGGRCGAVLLYRSADGVQWQYRGPLFSATDATLGTMWECPNLLRFGERWVLTVSQWPRLGALAFVGRLDGDRFVADRMQVLDGDGSAFAHLALHAPDGRVLQWAWIDEQRDAQQVAAEGWAGALSVPRLLWLDDDARLCSRPVDELAALREAPAVIEAGRRFSGRHLDLHARFVLHTRQDAGLTVLASPDGRERTRIVWRAQAQRLVIERSRSSIDTGTCLQDQQAALALAPGEALALRVLVDASVIEVFANGRVVLTSRVYPALSASVHGEAFSDGPADLDLQAWTMRSMHADPHRGLP